MAEIDYTKQLKIENANLEAEIQKKQSEFRVYDRINDYYSQDEVMSIFIQKLLTILYVVIYFFFIYFLYLNSERPKMILYLLIFFLLPFTFHVVSRFLYSLFLMILHQFNNGNAVYLYQWLNNHFVSMIFSIILSNDCSIILYQWLFNHFVSMIVQSFCPKVIEFTIFSFSNDFSSSLCLFNPLNR